MSGNESESIERRYRKLHPAYTQDKFKTFLDCGGNSDRKLSDSFADLDRTGEYQRFFVFAAATPFTDKRVHLRWQKEIKELKEKRALQAKDRLTSSSRRIQPLLRNLFYSAQKPRIEMPGYSQHVPPGRKPVS